MPDPTHGIPNAHGAHAYEIGHVLSPGSIREVARVSAETPPDGEQARAPRARPAGAGFSAQPGSTHAREYCICLAYFCKECV
jgi:hypothetical protein